MFWNNNTLQLIIIKMYSLGKNQWQYTSSIAAYKYYPFQISKPNNFFIIIINLYHKSMKRILKLTLLKLSTYITVFPFLTNRFDINVYKGVKMIKKKLLKLNWNFKVINDRSIF